MMTRKLQPCVVSGGWCNSRDEERRAPYDWEFVAAALAEVHASRTFCGTCHSASSTRVALSGFTSELSLAR